MLNWIGKFEREAVGLSFWLGMAFVGYFTILTPKSLEVSRATYMPLRLATAEGMKLGAPVRMLGVEYGFLSSLHYMEVDETGWPIPWTGAPRGRTGVPSGQIVIGIVDLVDRPLIYPDYEIFTRTDQPLAPKGVDIRPGNARSGEELTPLLLDQAERLHFTQTGILPRRAKILAAKNFDDPLFQIAVILTENRDGIRRITYNSAQFTEKINHGDGTLALLLNRNDIYGGTDKVLKELIYFTGDARDLLESARESRQPVEFLETFITIFFTLI